MAHKLALIFAVLALSSIANAVVTTNAPITSAFSVTPGQIFNNATTTDAAFVNLTGPVSFAAGWDNTTNYIAVYNITPGYYLDIAGTIVSQTATAITVQRRAINASSPATVNATLDTKITTTALTNGSFSPASGMGYFGFASVYNSDASLTYFQVNGSTPTTVKIATSTDTSISYVTYATWYDTQVFYTIYGIYNKTANADDGSTNGTGIWIQGVSVATGAVIYNTTGGAKLLTLNQNLGTISLAVSGVNYTNSTTANVLVRDSQAGTVSVMSVTLATGAATTATVLATDDSTTNTTYSLGGVFGSIGGSGYFVNKMVNATTNTTAVYINGTLTTLINFTNPTGYSNPMIYGAATPVGFALFAMYPVSDTTVTTGALIYKNTYFTNLTSILTNVNLGTYTAPAPFTDAAGSPWLGYSTSDPAYGDFMVSASAGQLIQQTVGANLLTSIFATLALMIVALFAF